MSHSCVGGKQMGQCAMSAAERAKKKRVRLTRCFPASMLLHALVCRDATRKLDAKEQQQAAEDSDAAYDDNQAGMLTPTTAGKTLHRYRTKVVQSCVWIGCSVRLRKRLQRTL